MRDDSFSTLVGGAGHGPAPPHISPSGPPDGFNRAPAAGMRLAPLPCDPDSDSGDSGGAAAEEFYRLHGRTRLMLAREFESFGMEPRAAAGYSHDVLTMLAIVFFAQGSGLAAGTEPFAAGIARALDGRTGGRSALAWDYIAGKLLPGFGRGPLARAAWGPGAAAFGAPPPPGARMLDIRPAEFFDDAWAGGRRRQLAPRGHGAGREDLAARHAGLSPVIGNLLAMSAHALGNRARAILLGRMFEGSPPGAGGAGGRRLPGRKREGAYYTPAYVARRMCRDAIIPWLSASGAAADPESLVSEYAGNSGELEARLRRIRILDPACGPGAFLIEAACTLLDVHAEIEARAARRPGPGGGARRATPADVAGRLYGMDKDPRAAATARLALLLLAAGPPPCQPPDLSGNIVARDSVANREGGWDAEFPGVFRGGGFDVIVGNPPYVRHEELRGKASMALPPGRGLALPPGFEIPRKSDLASYFHYHSVAALAPGGRLAFIASDGWLSHAYGLPLQRALLDNCRIDALLRPSYNVFGGADIKTAVLHLTRGPAGPGHRITVAAIGGPGGLAGWRGGTAARPLQADAEPGNWLAQFFDAVPAPRAPMTTAGAAGRVASCVKTGRDGFFVLTPKAVRGYGIGGAFRRPVLSARADDGCLEGRRAREHLLSVDLPKARLAETAGGRAVLRYIEAAESVPVAPKRGASRKERAVTGLASLRGRSPWYSLGLRGDPPPVYLSIFTHKRIKVYRNDGRFFARNNFAAFTPRNGAHADAMSAHFASSWFGLHMEAYGHVAGGGALQFLISDFGRSPVPDLGRMGRGAADALGSAWRSYCADHDRARLDDAVLAVLGFTEAERSEVAGRLREAVSRRTGAGAAA